MKDLDKLILAFIRKRGSVEPKELKKEFVKTGKCAYSTLYYRLNRLMRSREIIKRLDEKTGRQKYLIFKEREEESKPAEPRLTLEGFKKTYLIAAVAHEYPYVKYSKIAKIFNVSLGAVKKCIHRLKHGQIKLTPEQIKRIAAQYEKFLLIE